MCAEIISFNTELSPPIYGLPTTMQRIIQEVSEKRQAAIDFALGPALGAASIAIYDSRHDVNVITEHGGRVDGERGAGFIVRQRLDGVVVEFGKRKVHN